MAKKLRKSLAPRQKVVHAVLINGPASTTDCVTMLLPISMADIAVLINHGKQRDARAMYAHMEVGPPFAFIRLL